MKRHKREKSQPESQTTAEGAPAKPPSPSGEASESAEQQSSVEVTEQLRQEIERANDRYLRTLAEFDNARKRLQREKDEFTKYAAETIVRQLLPIVDSLDQALLTAGGQVDPSGVIQGVQLIHRQLADLLENEGVQRIATVGEAFDPHRHEAVAKIETQDGTRDNTVVEEVQVGYTMHGRVIRPAMVKVAKTTDEQSGDSRQTSPVEGDDPQETNETTDTPN